MDIRAFRMEAWEMMSVMMDAEIPRVLGMEGYLPGQCACFCNFRFTCTGRGMAIGERY